MQILKTIKTQKSNHYYTRIINNSNLTSFTNIIKTKSWGNVTYNNNPSES